MYRPNVPAMDEIEAVLRDIQDMEQAIRKLRDRLRELPIVLAGQLSTEEERLNAARYLYWMVPEVPSNAIAQGMLGIGVHKLREIIGSIEGEIDCERCGKPIHFRSRTHMKEIIKASASVRPRYAEGYRVLCEKCWKKIQDERHKEYERHVALREARLQELKTMPYEEYLKTPEWQARRKQHLRSVGYRCQVCNATGVPLDVHHRTYERRGEEHYKDLIALCRDCHELFHISGKLAG